MVYVVPKIAPAELFEKSTVGVRVERWAVEFPGVGGVIVELLAAEAGIKELMLACPGTYDTVGEL